MKPPKFILHYRSCMHKMQRNLINLLKAKYIFFTKVKPKLFICKIHVPPPPPPYNITTCEIPQ